MVPLQSHTIISVSPARVLQLCFKKLFCSEIKLTKAQRLKVVKMLAALSILNSSGARPGATEKVARAICSCAGHSSASLMLLYQMNESILKRITIGWVMGDFHHQRVKKGES